MKKITYTLLMLVSLISFSGCSIAPGMPGLKVASSRYAKEQKEGVDYKLVIINAQTIQNQKPFDYVTYINKKKKRSNSYALLNKSNASFNNSRHKINYNHKPKFSNNIARVSSGSIHSNNNFSGVTSNDVKANYQYTVGKGDILSITVWDHPELTIPSGNNTVTGHVVDNDGRFYFPHSGKIQASGKTAKAIRNALEKKLGSFYTKPQVSVSVINFRSQKVYTSGAIRKPSTLTVDDVAMTVRDAISKSGGVVPTLFTGFASLARKNQRISIDLNRMLKYNDNRQNFLLKDGDRLHIIERDELSEWRRKLNLEIQRTKILSPLQLQFELDKERSISRLRKELERELKSEQAKVFVMGEVIKSGSVKYQVEDGMTLVEAINDAGSFKEDTVNPKGIFVIRKETEKDKIPTVYQLPIASVQSMFFAEQFNLRPRDIIYVTATPSIRWNRVLAQLLPSLAIVNTIRNFR